MSAPVPGSSARSYVLDNQHDAACAHHSALAELLDPFTTQRIVGLRSRWSGASCLEVGAGHGSVALWLADQVKDTGIVVATDLKPDNIPPHPQLKVVAHDLTSDRSWPDLLAGPFDLIHARLTLLHLPRRAAVLSRLASLLADGGVLLVEDWAPMRDHMVVAAPNTNAEELYAIYQSTAAAVFDAAGNDPTWARRIHTDLLRLGLVEVNTVVHGEYWTGGGPGCRLVAAAATQLRPRLIDAGMTNEQLQQLDRLLGDSRLVLHGHPLYSCSGRGAT